MPLTTIHSPLPSRDSNFRQVWPVTDQLLKIKRQAREEEACKKPSGSRDVHEKKVG